MNQYKADLGCWEEGITVEFEAQDKHAALTRAAVLLEEEILGHILPASSVIVQMSEEDVCVYDYMNGFYSGNLLAYTTTRSSQ